MWIVALQAVANCRRMHRALDLRRVLIGVTREAKSVRRRGDELYARYIAVDAHFVARRASQRHRRMNRLAFRLVLMTFEALR